jgi:hypothetical protein
MVASWRVMVASWRVMVASWRVMVAAWSAMAAFKSSMNASWLSLAVPNVIVEGDPAELLLSEMDGSGLRGDTDIF